GAPRPPTGNELSPAVLAAARPRPAHQHVADGKDKQPGDSDRRDVQAGEGQLSLCLASGERALHVSAVTAVDGLRRSSRKSRGCRRQNGERREHEKLSQVAHASSLPFWLTEIVTHSRSRVQLVPRAQSFETRGRLAWVRCRPR